MVDDWASLLDLGTYSPYVHLLFYNFLKEDQSFLLKAERELLKMASCCQKCGVTGYEELLVYCRKCRISAEHRYCLDKLPKNTNSVHWFCEQCEPTSSNIDSHEELHIEFDSCPSTSPKQDEGRTLKRRRISILADADHLDQKQELQSGRGKQNVSKKATLPSSEPELQSDCGDQDGRKKATVPSSEPELQSDCGDQNGNKKSTVPSSERDLQSHHGDQNGSKKAIASSSEPELLSHRGDQNDNKKATVASSEPELQSHCGDQNVSKEATVPSSEPELHSDCGGQNVVNKATVPSSEPVLSSPAPHANSSDEVTIGPLIVVLERSASQAMVQEEINLCSVTRPIFDHNVSNKDIAPSSQSVLALLTPHTSSSDDGRIDSRIVVQETSAFQAMMQEEVDASAVARPISEHVWRNMDKEGPKKRARGINRMGELILLRNKNKRLNVDLNDFNAHLGETGVKLSSYIGIVARYYVLIDIVDWRVVSKELKNKIWDDIQSVFILEENAKKDILKMAGHDWKNFKSNLTTKYIKTGKTKNPPEKYDFIEQEVWEQFVFLHSTAVFQSTSKTNAEN